jgi:hypothetical protein
MSWEKSGGYPVPGAVRTESIAWSVLDELATTGMIHGAIREALYVRLRSLVSDGDQVEAEHVLRAFLDCWSLGTLVDGARQEWFEDAAAEALVVLVRAAEVIQLAIGWPAGPAGPWPVPDASWFTVKDQIWTPAPVRPFPYVGEVTADQLVAHRAEWVSRILKGEVSALHVTELPTEQGAFTLAMGEVRMESPAQERFERAGFAATHVDELSVYGQGWVEPPPGQAGDVFVAVADGVVVPALDTGAPMAMVGWLLWSGSYRPRAVHPVAIAALQAMDGQTSSIDVAESLEISMERWSDIEQSLLVLGAITAVV